MNGYDAIYDQLLPRLKQCDLEKHAKNLGLVYEDSRVKVDFMGEEFTVTNEGVTPYEEDGNAISVPITLVYYILSEGIGEASDHFVARHNLSNAMAGMFNKPRLTEPVLIAAKGRYDIFAQAAEKLGGKYMGERKGGHFWVFAPLPKTPIGFNFIEADDELPAELLITVSANATDFLEYECLNSLEGIVIDRIKKEAARLTK